MVAYYFPPMGLSGVQRIAKFVKYLPASGWRPTVLTVAPGGYFAYDEALEAEMAAAGVEVVRTRSLDPTRLFGRRRQVALPAEQTRRRAAQLSQWVMVPDNKVGWLPFAVASGLRLHRERRFDAVLSTAPPYTGHLVAAALARLSGLPLLLDYRDDWLENPRHTYPTAAHQRLHALLEGWVMRRAAQVLTINEPIRRALRRRHPATPVEVLPQGYDPADFAQAPAARTPGRLRFVYTGVFYDVQTPDYFLRALARLLARRPEARGEVEAVFVGLVPEASRALAADLGLGDVVRWTGYVDHPTAVAHQQAADVLWLTVGRRPGAEGISTGKLFEYLGARRPILALVPEGTVRETLAPYGAAFVAEPDDEVEIEARLEACWEGWRGGGLPVPNEPYAATFDRRRLTARLASHLDALAAAPAR